MRLERKAEGLGGAQLGRGLGGVGFSSSFSK